MLKETIVQGIESDKYAFAGPRLLQLDITNDCNTNCVGCWCHSDYLGDQKLKGEEKKKHLSLKKIREIINDAARLEVESIQLAGSGEPLLHPDSQEVIRYIKSKGFELEIVTNGICLSPDFCKLLVSSGVDKLAVSMWAGSPSTYTKVHPNQSEKTFFALRDNLRHLCELKKKENGFPLVRIYNVISRLNYDDIEAMIDFAIDVGANSVEFQPIDIMLGKTDFLKLKGGEIKKIEKTIKRIKRKKDFLEVNMFEVGEFGEFGRFVIREPYKGFTYYVDDIYYYSVRCILDKWAARVIDDAQRTQIQFTFKKSDCGKCVRSKECFLDRTTFSTTMRYLSIVGINTFLRRVKAVQNKQQEEYDTTVKDLPCYVGWDYARILTSGAVIPCCKGYKKPLGNIHKNTFYNIWHSDFYNEFREKAKKIIKTDSYFEPMECLKGCDNYGRNASIAYELKIAAIRGVT